MRAPKSKFKWWLMVFAVLMLVTALVATSGSSVFVITRQDATGAVSIEVALPELGAAKVQALPDDRVVINLGDSPQGGSPGDPQLPYKLIRVLVPPDADLETVQAQLISGDWEELPDEYEIAPAPPAAASAPVIDFCGKDPAVIIDGKDTTIYGTDAYFPAESVEVVSVGLFRQWKLVEYRVWLAAYNPVKKKVRVLRNISTNLSVQPLSAAEATGLSSPTPPVLPNTEKFVPELLEKIANPQDLEAFYPAAEEAAAAGEAPGLIPADYVIITTSTIVGGSTNLAAFITAKQTAGYTVKTVTEGAVASDTTYVTGATCDQRADNIRSWLRANWASDGIQYVLLIGNPDPTLWNVNTSIPMKMCWPRSASASNRSAPSDMYFAELSSTWDMDGDGQSGEFVGDYGAGGCDKFCEVKVGRIPFYGSYVDLDAILQKSIDYRNASGDLSWRAKVLIPAAISNFGPQDNLPYGNYPGAEDQAIAVFGDNWGEAIKLLAPPYGFGTYTLYEKGGLAFPATACNAAITQANVVAEWQNNYGFVTWWGHGNQTGAYRRVWMNDLQIGDGMPQFPAETSDIVFIQNTDCPSLNDSNPSFVVQISCNNGWPENPSNLGYSLLKQGAIGTISGTRVTWYAVTVWNTGLAASVGDNASYGYNCFDQMAGSGVPIGDALVWCRGNFGTGWASGSSWMNMVDLTLYGDPSLSLVITGNVKWEQKPDLTENGIDIRCDRDDGTSRILADDFLCTTTGPITKVVLWGSWLDDQKGRIQNLHLSIHDDDPCGPMGWSEPNNLLWSRDFSSAEVNETLYATLSDPEWWWDPASGLLPVFPGDYQVWQYDITIDSTSQFVQQGDPCNPVVYWLDVYVELEVDPQDPNIYEFGWKTRDITDGHFNDDAVWSSDDGTTWNELRYQPGHNYFNDSIDMAFKIITGEPAPPSYLKWSQPPVEWVEPNVFVGWDEESHDWLPRMVADDFLCDTNRPVTAIRWWGSFLGWNQQLIPPQLPKAFYLTIWTDVPDPDPCEPDDYSHPNEIIWQNYCSCYDVKFVGWEFDPINQEITLPKFEFYQELDPCDYWYQPNDVNVYWLGITAIYGDMPEDPCYPWGWETREHFFKDDAVRLFEWPEPNISYTASQFEPIKLQGETWDLSFELISRPKIPPKPPVPHLKWSQPPIERDVNPFEMPVYWGWDEKSYNKDLQDPCGPWRIVADDFRCLGPMPITSIHWWGSHYGWEDATQTPPASDLPEAWRIGFWSNVPEVGAPEVGAPQAGQKTNLGEAALSAKAVSSAKPSPLLPVRRTAATKTARSLQATLEKPSVRAIPSSLSASRSAVGGVALGGGDTCATATVIGALPFSDTGETCSFADDYDEVCPFTGSTSPDVAYSYTPASNIAIDISLCDSTYDTKVYVYVGGCPGTLVACNDDACGGDGYKSQLLDVSLTAGNTYYIIVDGYGGYCGDYIIDVAENVPPPPPPDCPPDNTLFGQPVHGPGDSWTAINSDAGSTYLVYENFWGVNGEICDIHFWGLDVYWDEGWYECDEDPMTFEIKFYQNDPCGDPGTEVCSYTVPITRMATGLQYAGYDLWEYSATLESCCALTDGWVSIQGVSIGNPDCWFLWMSSGMGDGLSYQWQDPNLVQRTEDLSLCLTGEVPPPSFSYPEILLHEIIVPATRVDVNQVGTDTFCELCGIHPHDVCYQYYVDLDPCEVFWQDNFNDMTGDSVFWLSIVAIYPDACEPPDYPWGWKTRPWSWMDDAVTFNLQEEPEPGMALDPNSITPIKDPGFQESYDVAFELDTDPNYIKWEQPYDSIRHWPHYDDESSWASESNETGELTYSRLVADDWKCERKTAVNAVAWWGSYIGYRSTPTHEGPWMTLPAKPDYFELRVWTDVPANDPGNAYAYSHPNEIVWEYRAYDYDEVFVGYDKQPHAGAHPNEPVFRYSVRLPDSERFKQPDVNDIYWLNVVAVYVSPRTPNYPWGWTNHEHVFNDDAVGGNVDVGTGQWYWNELCDQCGDSEDMSFVLFTHPGPDCWSWPGQCKGDCHGNDGDVDTDDFIAFKDAFGANYGNSNYNPCADFDRDGDIDTDDFIVFKDNFGQTGLSGCTPGGHWPP